MRGGKAGVKKPAGAGFGLMHYPHRTVLGLDPRTIRRLCRADTGPRIKSEGGIVVGDLSRGFLEHQLDVVPVHQVVEPGFEVFRAGVAVVDVIGVFPHIDAQDRVAAMDQGRFAIGGLGDFELAVLDGQPGPAGAELGGAGGDEIQKCTWL